MRSIDFRVDVSGATDLDDGTAIAATLFLPDDDPATGWSLLFCLHGAGYDRRYWNPPFDTDASYSFARFFTKQGRAVVALDMLGMGASSRPDPENRLSRAAIAHAHAAVLADVRGGLTDGRWSSAGVVSVTGIGHSMGGMMLITQAASEGGMDRLAVIGWTNQPLSIGGADPEMLRTALPESGYVASPRAAMRPLFYGSDVPAAVIEADEACGSTTPACLGRDALADGVVHEASAALRMPILIVQSEIDTSPYPWREPAFFSGSDDVTLHVLRGAAHCQNLASSRHQHWQRLDRWIMGQEAGASVIPAARALPA